MDPVALEIQGESTLKSIHFDGFFWGVSYQLVIFSARQSICDTTTVCVGWIPMVGGKVPKNSRISAAPQTVTQTW